MTIELLLVYLAASYGVLGFMTAFFLMCYVATVLMFAGWKKGVSELRTSLRRTARLYGRNLPWRQEKVIAEEEAQCRIWMEKAVLHPNISWGWSGKTRRWSMEEIARQGNYREFLSDTHHLPEPLKFWGWRFAFLVFWPVIFPIGLLYFVAGIVWITGRWVVEKLAPEKTESL